MGSDESGAARDEDRTVHGETVTGRSGMGKKNAGSVAGGRCGRGSLLARAPDPGLRTQGWSWKGCKPNSVPGPGPGRASFISAAVLGTRLLSQRRRGQRLGSPFGLAPGRFSVPRRLRFGRWALTPPFTPRPRPFGRGGLFSVALSVTGLSFPAPAVMPAYPGFCTRCRRFRPRPGEFGLSSSGLRHQRYPTLPRPLPTWGDPQRRQWINQRASRTDTLASRRRCHSAPEKRDSRNVLTKSHATSGPTVRPPMAQGCSCRHPSTPARRKMIVNEAGLGPRTLVGANHSPRRRCHRWRFPPTAPATTACAEGTDETG